jgi:predicted nucleic acid-binding protein
MSAVVVDASVVAKWFVAEEQAELALQLLASPLEFLSPDLIWAEVGKVLWKRVRRNQISREEAITICDDLLQMPVETTPSQTLLSDAFEIAVDTDRTVYDSLYLALAIRKGCKMVTSDDKLSRSLAGTKLAEFVCSLSDIVETQ